MKLSTFSKLDFTKKNVVELSTRLARRSQNPCNSMKIVDKLCGTRQEHKYLINILSTLIKSSVSVHRSIQIYSESIAIQ